MTPLPPSALIPFENTSGRQSAKIALVGEAFGETEERIGLPFQGYSGQELTRMLGDAGIYRNDCFITNVFPFRPASSNNRIENLCGSKKDCGPGYSLAPLSQGKYILPTYLGCLDRLGAELRAVNPNLVVALGGTACWALLGTSAITRARGVIANSTLVPGLKVLPTFHPASVLRNWSQRPIVVADLMKAKLEAQFPEIRRPSRRLLVSPTLEELREWWTRIAPATPILACDIETKSGQITMISFANSHTEGVVVPFWLPLGSYWQDFSSECSVWDFVKEVLESDCEKLFQNGCYDLQYIIRLGVKPKNCFHDTMLLHHSLYPELPKSLGFMGSIYCNEAAWKDYRTAKEQKKDA